MTQSTMEQHLAELVRLARVQVHPVAKGLMQEVFFEKGEPRMDRIRAYASLDGSAQRIAAERSGVTQSTISRWVNEWKRMGLVAEDGKAVFNVFDFFPELQG